MQKLSLAIPVYNEEDNILSLLSAIYKSSHNNYYLHELIVVSDGSVDHTNSLVAIFARSHPSLRLILGRRRLGKIARLNQIFRSFKGDVLCVLDGDIGLPLSTLNQMVRTQEYSVAPSLVAAHELPLRDNTLISRIIWVAYRIWDEARLSVPRGDHIQNFYGAATLYRGDFARSLHIPRGLTDERGYIYLKAREFGDFCYLFTAPIYYWPATTLHDFWQLSDRSFGKNIEFLKKYFSNDLTTLYRIPASYKIRSVISNWLHYPLLTPVALAINIFSRLFPVHDQLYNQGMWQIATSTKKRIVYATTI